MVEALAENLRGSSALGLRCRAMTFDDFDGASFVAVAAGDLS